MTIGDQALSRALEGRYRFERAAKRRASMAAATSTRLAVLYEMLVGEQPFTGPTVQAVIAKRFVQIPLGWPNTEALRAYPEHQAMPKEIGLPGVVGD